MTKADKVLAIVVSAFVLAAVGFYFAWNAYFTESRIFKEQWNITMPDDMKSQYYLSSQGALGDGCTYSVYSMKSKDTSFLGKTSSSPNAQMQNEVLRILRILHADSGRYPNFSHPYEWKIFTSESDDRNKLYAVYDVEMSLLYFAQELY